MRLRAHGLLAVGAAVAVAVAATVACSRRGTDPPTSAPAVPASAPVASATSPTPTPAAEPAPAAAAALRDVRVVVLGDSLSAGDGLPAAQAFPSVLERLLRDEGIPVRIQNAGVSGDTSAGGLARLDWLLRQEPDVLVLELGANDGLRGLPVESTESNLRAIVERSRAAGVTPILVGMRVPENMGSAYAEDFVGMFGRVAAGTGTPLVPFLLEGVALVPELNLPDGIHPTAAGQEILARNVLPVLEPVVREEAAEAR